MKGSIHIGTSGWHYKHWKGLYYPSTLKPGQWLHYISQDFDCTEINNSFYRVPTVEAVQQWIAQTGRRFRFCPKLNRMVTHFKKLHDPQPLLQQFFDVFNGMAHRMGPVLVQLPRQVTFHAGVAQQFYEALAAWPYRFSMEVRDHSWLEKESLALMERYGVGWV
ncbi:MAG TPA: DUF72 domain-containing protein, partial [Chitinophaga sp.]